jgi:hypothetical protein
MEEKLVIIDFAVSIVTLKISGLKQQLLDQ